ncbi:uncharacterized protein ARMOST_09562 [Armillaria ostoyae]|uniref:Uncharacterized protein n=1 Tax=Armillaria ostoyae TaxID=47428 RepID=A0A284RBT1_ARMOS|nr:uncharacterized protein ARMOST_09562 [Armillaria ostoyae]
MAPRCSKRLTTLPPTPPPPPVPKTKKANKPPPTPAPSTPSHRESSFHPSVFHIEAGKTFASDLDLDATPPTDLNWALPVPLAIMPPEIFDYDIMRTLIINSRAFRRLVSYDPEERCLVAHPYPGSLNAQGQITYLPYDSLVNFFATNKGLGLQTPSCICGPVAGDWNLYTPTKLLQMSENCARAENRGQLAFVCSKGRGGCRWWQPLVHLFAGNQGPADVVPCIERDEFIGYVQHKLTNIHVVPHKKTASSPATRTPTTPRKDARHLSTGLTNPDGSLPSLSFITDSGSRGHSSTHSSIQRPSTLALLDALDRSAIRGLKRRVSASHTPISHPQKKSRKSDTHTDPATPAKSEPIPPARKVIPSRYSGSLVISANRQAGDSQSTESVFQPDSNDPLFFVNDDGHSPSNQGSELEYNLAPPRIPAPRLKVPQTQSTPTHSPALALPTSENLPGSSSSNGIIEISSDSEEDTSTEGFVIRTQCYGERCVHIKLPATELARLKRALISPAGVTLDLLQRTLTMCERCKFYYLTLYCGGEHQCAHVDLTGI